MAALLVTAQALWGTAIKSGALSGSISHIASTLLTSWRMWAGALIYIVATLLYFYLLSRLKFYSVQIPMTALAIMFSTVLSIVLFKETPSIVNSIGIAIVAVGIILILQR